MIHPRVELHATIKSLFAIRQVQKIAETAESGRFRQLMPVPAAIAEWPGILCQKGKGTPGLSLSSIGLVPFHANC